MTAQEIRDFPETPPETTLLIEARVPKEIYRSQIVKEIRTYEIIPALLKNGYVSRWSAGARLWTNADSGPDSEPIIAHRNWILLDDKGGYIGSFEHWTGALSVREFFVHFLRAEILDTLTI